MTGCTNSTATWRAWAGHCGATHHRVAPAANRRARASAAGARSSAGPAPSAIAVRVHAAHVPRPAAARTVPADRRLSQCEAAVVGWHDPVRQHAEMPWASSSRRARPRSSAFWKTPPLSATTSMPVLPAGAPPHRRSRGPRRCGSPQPWRRCRTAAQVLDQRPEDGGGSNSAPVRSKRYGRRVPPTERLFGRPLQVQGRLRLVGRVWRRPSSELTASNRRPMLDVATHPDPRSSWRARTARSSVETALAGGRSAAHSIPAAHRCASAARQGRRMAASPPGSGTDLRCPTRRTPRSRRRGPPRPRSCRPFRIPSRRTRCR